MQPLPLQPQKTKWGAFFLLWAALAAAYFASPNVQVLDSHYTLLTSETLLRHGDVRLERYMRFPHSEERWPGTFRRDLAPRQIVYVGEHLYYGFPVGSSLLSLPFLAAANAIGLSTIAQDGAYDARNEVRLQRVAAAGLVSLAVAVLFLLASQIVPPAEGLLAALLLGLGSPYWSSLALGLWGQDWLVLLLGSLLLHLVAAERSGRDPSPPWIALLGALMLSVRWTSVISLAVCAIYLAQKKRRCLGRTALWGALFVGLLLFFNLWAYGSLLQPLHYQGKLWTADGIPWRALALLASPSRGVLVFVPLAALAILLCVVHLGSVPQRALVGAGLGAVGLHFAMLCCFREWWGGYSYGPRLFADVLPWIFLLGVAGWAAARSAWTTKSRRSLAAVIFALGLWSVFVHWRGATNPDTLLWNSDFHVENHPEMFWSWPGQIWPPPRGIGDPRPVRLFADDFERGTIGGWDLVVR